MQEIFTAVFRTISNWKQPRYSSTIEWLNKLCHIAIMEHRKTAIKINKNNDQLLNMYMNNPNNVSQIKKHVEQKL